MQSQSILNNIQLLIESLKHDYIAWQIRGHQYQIEKNESVDYHQSKIDELKSGKCGIDYVIETGKKYLKVVMISSGDSRSVHCFVDKNNGQVYKAATWKSPAKGVRFNLTNEDDLNNILEKCDWSGSYLYAR